MCGIIDFEYIYYFIWLLDYYCNNLFGIHLGMIYKAEINMQIYFNASMIRLLFIDYERFETNQIIVIAFIIETQQSSHKLSFKVNQEIKLESICGTRLIAQYENMNSNVQQKKKKRNGR